MPFHMFTSGDNVPASPEELIARSTSDLKLMHEAAKVTEKYLKDKYYEAVEWSNLIYNEISRRTS